nr:MAG TPA: hypothetical protein [Caudoviricetes sp.]
MRRCFSLTEENNFCTRGIMSQPDSVAMSQPYLNVHKY